MNQSKSFIKLPEALLDNLPDSRPKPYFHTWLKLEKNVPCGVIKEYSKKKHRIAKEIGVSERTLRNHLKDILSEGLATLENDTLRLVSKWRTPYFDFTYRFKSKKKHTKAKTKPVLLDNLSSVKEATFHTKLSSQLRKQKYVFDKKNEALGKKKKVSREKQIANSIYTIHNQSGKLQNEIQQGYLSDPNFDASEYVKGIKYSAALIGHHLKKHEQPIRNNEEQLGLKKISEITGFNSFTSIRKYRRKLRAKKVLTEVRAKLKRVIKYVWVNGVKQIKKIKFSPKYHIMDKFGNIYRKESNTYQTDRYYIAINIDGSIRYIN